MKNLNLPDTQQLIWFGIGVWMMFMLRRLWRAKDDGITGFMMYLILMLAPAVVIVFQDQLVAWLEAVRNYKPADN